MPTIIISDTSCLILLDKIEELNLLKTLFGTCVVTTIVATEFGKPLPNWIFIQDPQGINSQIILEVSLDQGEASSIALAMEQNDCLLIIDEYKGRKIAKQLGLSITGTLGLIAEAKILGNIKSVKPILEKIKRTNFRLSEELQIAILKKVNE
jgi:predicted nucleic acid-binding protein